MRPARRLRLDVQELIKKGNLDLTKKKKKKILCLKHAPSVDLIRFVSGIFFLTASEVDLHLPFGRFELKCNSFGSTST